MSHDPQSRFEQDRSVDARVDSPAREGLTGTSRANLYEAGPDAGERTAPDGKPWDQQPHWRRDFAIDWPEDNFIARRDFAKFLVLTSGAFVVGQGWIAAKSMLADRVLPRRRIASLRDLPAGTSIVFYYPGAHDNCLLIRTHEGALLAYSQKCTHLACAVVPRVAQGVLYCPCHEGYFELATGRNIAGPPPRPLPAIELEVSGDEVFAVGVKQRTV